MEVPKIIRTHWQVLLVVSLMVFGIAWRLVPHVPNFAPIGAIALLAGMVLGWRMAIWLPISIMLVSDLVIGFYAGIEWTWISFGIIVLFAYLIRRLPTTWRLPIGALGASLLFFVVSNFGVWVASGMYAHTLSGLIDCYVMGLPFFRATLLSDLFFAVALIGSYELIRRPIALALTPARI